MCDTRRQAEYGSYLPFPGADEQPQHGLSAARSSRNGMHVTFSDCEEGKRRRRCSKSGSWKADDQLKWGKRSAKSAGLAIEEVLSRWSNGELLMFKLWQLTRVPRESVTQATGQEITECFEILRSILQAQPTSTTQPYDGDLGVNLRGKLLRSLIRAAANMGADRFAVDLFFERVDMQLRRPNQRIISLKQIATDITHNRWWLLGARLLDPERIPEQLLSPEVITVAMNCTLIARRPWDTKKLFAMMHPDEAGPDSICYYLQALLQLGDRDGAHRVMQVAMERGVDPEKVQVAMVKGGGRGEDM
ncbi:hypothetical protein A1Q2_03612 [Trichosporon asahii var. asahii CBS 8904]|uniref:Uncharacterized protein n=1 Tax=Trichosporon asahii var. asahii (strain CBS 8904) TaxID=1220162 RepID=K1VDK0_TRIAC|nr:hypothetical protein A1Q2_03612 [Trichosporon asahii var. asahii CBS 8904]